MCQYYGDISYYNGDLLFQVRMTTVIGIVAHLILAVSGSRQYCVSMIIIIIRIA